MKLDAESYTYPRHILNEDASGLLLFCSGRGGAADGHWFREAGMKDVTAVDWDEATFKPFQRDHPTEWTYVLADVFLFASATHRKWDVVSVDAPSQYERILDWLPRFYALANRAVTLTVTSKTHGLFPPPQAPVGWRIEPLIERNTYNGTTFYWLTLVAE